MHLFSDASKFAYSTVAFLRVDTGSAVHVQLAQSKVRIAPCGKKETTIASRNIRVVAWILRFIHNISNVNKLRGNLVYEEFKKAENLVFKSMQLRSFQDEKFLAKIQDFKDEEGLLRIRTKLVDSDEKEDFKFPVLLPANDVVVKLIREEHKKAMHAASIVQQDVYLDDILTGCSNLKGLEILKSELVQLFESAGMSLRKWCFSHSNSDLPDLQFDQLSEEDILITLSVSFCKNARLSCGERVINPLSLKELQKAEF
ncbi:integrase_H2C2 domain-containing protein [Nephila pilipes]|uniref:Integrase_H2C2 domain-containing protein n=1 Tax=Nephila pilipes TaxID=299642 RepID=A0A8X6PEK7_NEPPI|nr:integrase_H2C2 domain-containing protein [Nephila pilipes]